MFKQEYEILKITDWTVFLTEKTEKQNYLSMRFHYLCTNNYKIEKKLNLYF